MGRVYPEVLGWVGNAHVRFPQGQEAKMSFLTLWTQTRKVDFDPIFRRF